MGRVVKAIAALTVWFLWIVTELPADVRMAVKVDGEETDAQ